MTQRETRIASTLLSWVKKQIATTINSSASFFGPLKSPDMPSEIKHVYKELQNGLRGHHDLFLFSKPIYFSYSKYQNINKLQASAAEPKNWGILPKIIPDCSRHTCTDSDSSMQTCTCAHTVACTQHTQPETHVTVLTSVFLNLALRLFMFSPTHAVAHSIAQSRLQRRREEKKKKKKTTQMFKLSLCDVSSHFKCDSVFLKTWFLGFV